MLQVGTLWGTYLWNTPRIKQEPPAYMSHPMGVSLLSWKLGPVQGGSVKFLQTTGKITTDQRQAGGSLCLHSSGCCFEVLHVEPQLGLFPLHNNYTTFALNQGGVENQKTFLEWED